MIATNVHFAQVPVKVLGLYRKREWARGAQGHVVYARFR